jgi:beta-lactamase class A
MNRKNLIIFAAIFLTGFACGISVFSLKNSFFSEETASRQVRQGENAYEYINPLLECEVADGVLDARKENFHDDLENFVENLQKDTNLTDVAIYFRDLNNGPAFGINQEKEFFPASLLKVPVMMVYYHIAEKDPHILETEIPFEATRDFGITPTILPRESIQVGSSYTIEELIHRMIVYSDNQALYLLASRIPSQEIQSLFALIGADTAILSDRDARLTVKEYAGFFRILFNSSYLSHEYSEKALKLLASTDYHDGLPAGVPEEVGVAHKFGEAGTEETERQLHDCGIVYFPNHPYLACVMTRGRDITTLKTSIRDISQFIYNKINEQY